MYDKPIIFYSPKTFFYSILSWWTVLFCLKFDGVTYFHIHFVRDHGYLGAFFKCIYFGSHRYSKAMSN